MNDIHRSFFLPFLSVVFAGLASLPAIAADESPWSEDVRSAVRLIAGSSKPGAAALRAGIEIKLRPGWKTYWRYPGDSGVPPHFDFAGSDNLKQADVLFPAPHLFVDETGQSLGYKDTIIFPVVVTPKEKGKPVHLRMKVDYAVCEKLCVPAEGRAELLLSGGDSSQNASLAAAEAQVPKRVTAAQLGLTARRANAGSKPVVTVELGAPAGKPLELFAEGPSPDWALPIPKPVKNPPPGRAEFTFALDGLPPGVDPKGQFDLTFTVVTGGRAVEVRSHLD
ncbi:MAG TPA: protein-disulfide reductase DsbD domain-containing protein [Pseudolabrys sp.]|nr:protein-disulfide reductase DsbD domain-containing protein [Pseudolabrys sp.]